MKDKFNLTREQNVFVAKRNIVDYIWKSANLEEINVSYFETQAIYDGGVVTFDGPATDGDGALDYDNELVITKGISNTSSQYGVLINFDKTYQNGSVTTITNSNNEEIMSYTSTKNFSFLCYSNSNLVNGESYQVKINDETV